MLNKSRLWDKHERNEHQTLSVIRVHANGTPCTALLDSGCSRTIVTIAFGEVNSRHHKFWLSIEFLKVYVQKPRDNNIFCWLLQGLWHKGKMEQILLAYGLPKESITAIMMLYRDGHTDYFDIVVGVLQGDTFSPYRIIICLDYVLRTSIDKMKDNGFKLTKERNRRYHVNTIMDADYADDIAPLANTPAQAKTLLHSLERAAAGIGLHTQDGIQVLQSKWWHLHTKW